MTKKAIYCNQLSKLSSIELNTQRLQLEKFADPDEVQMLVDETFQSVRPLVKKYPGVTYVLEVSGPNQGHWTADFIAFSIGIENIVYKGENRLDSNNFAAVKITYTDEGYILDDGYESYIQEFITQKVPKALAMLDKSFKWVNKTRQNELNNVPEDVQEAFSSRSSYLIRTCRNSKDVSNLINFINTDYLNNQKLKKENPPYYQYCKDDFLLIIDYIQQYNLSLSEISSLARTCKKMYDTTFFRDV